MNRTVRKQLSKQLREWDASDMFGTYGNTDMDDTSLYAYEVDVDMLDKRHVEINSRLNEYRRRNKHRARYKNLRGADIRCRKDRFLGFVPEYGYLRARDPKTWDYLYDLRNALVKEVGDDNVDNVNMLLVNHAKKLHHVVEMDQNKQNLVDKSLYDDELMRVYQDAMDFVMSDSFMNTAPESVRFEAKKLSSLGFPWETVDGIPITTEMLKVYTESGIDDDDHFRSKRFSRDWSPFKLEWRSNLEKGSLKIFDNQVEFISKHGVEVSVDNVIPLMESCMINVHKTAERENAMKPPLVGREILKPGAFLPIDDRKYCKYVVDDGNIVGRETGVISGEKYARIVNRVTKMDGAVNRNRIISPSDNNMNCIGTLLCSFLLYEMEHDNPKGNPTPRPIISEDVSKFAKKVSGLGFELKVLNIDCVNAEVTMGSNFWVLENLVPKRFLNYLKLTANSVSTYKQFLRFMEDSFCSAVWYTTFGNLIKGNFEMCRLVLKLFEENGIQVSDRKQFVRAYVLCMCLTSKYGWTPEKKKELIGKYYDVESDALISVEENWAVNPKLGTDDVICHVGTRKTLVVTKGFKTCCDKTMMDAKLADSVVSFGSYITSETLTVNAESGLSKPHFSESMGFSLHDGFATFAKISNSAYVDIFNFMLRKHFGVSVSQYAPFADGFIGFLEERGLAIDQVLNDYIPSERVLIDKFVKERYYKELEGVQHEFGYLVDAATITMRSAKTPTPVVEAIKARLSDYFYKE